MDKYLELEQELKRKQHYRENAVSQIQQWRCQDVEEIQHVGEKSCQEIEQRAKYQEQAIDGRAHIHGPMLRRRSSSSSKRGRIRGSRVITASPKP